jgi:hypothetical protein
MGIVENWQYLLIAHSAFAIYDPWFYPGESYRWAFHLFSDFCTPNNDAVRRDAALIIASIYNSTTFEIIDDGTDGDSDDSKTGMLMA